MPGAFRLWESIQALFRLIRLGCTTSQLVVPAYNGDLFSPQHTALLDAIRVPDSTLAEVLRELSVTPPTKDRGRERIDYQDLGVEQLGAVYEGLLEYEPKIAAEPMVEVRYKGDTCIGYLTHPFEKWIAFCCKCARSDLFTPEEMPFKQRKKLRTTFPVSANNDKEARH